MYCILIEFRPSEFKIVKLLYPRQIPSISRTDFHVECSAKDQRDTHYFKDFFRDKVGKEQLVSLFFVAFNLQAVRISYGGTSILILPPDRKQMQYWSDNVKLQCVILTKEEDAEVGIIFVNFTQNPSDRLVGLFLKEKQMKQKKRKQPKLKESSSKRPKPAAPAPSSAPTLTSVEDKPDALPEPLDVTPTHKPTFTETALGLPISPLSSPEHKTEPTLPPTQSQTCPCHKASTQRNCVWWKNKRPQKTIG